MKQVPQYIKPNYEYIAARLYGELRGALYIIEDNGTSPSAAAHIRQTVELFEFLDKPLLLIPADEDGT